MPKRYYPVGEHGVAKKYLSADIPYPFETREQYERSLRTPQRKAADYMNGTVYLTSHRIIYVDFQNPTTNSIAVEIKLIKGREFV
ncbi:small-subunit processome [Gigaspora margarita]|uniref:Small-subunit processome n=1 Tax=Gigaspora margarita TaxID=4874 RepID=A0A8H4APS6_GIGMA|nr:small-subunit processome [Gigaspora margarita]